MGDSVEGSSEAGEARGPPGLGPEVGARHRSIGKDQGLEPTGVGVEPFFEAGGGTRRGRRGGELIMGGWGGHWTSQSSSS